MDRVYIKKHDIADRPLAKTMFQSDLTAVREVSAILWYNLVDIYFTKIAEICREKFEGETYENI